ncbi:MAG TPA: septal ring lytic transglycosylase RlpA family protein [Treponemataceae bacterium]|nr:septal ring lytic transglycosylase RlpA family protein [Treponemataceae bacterium]HPS43057.1 septal ring lytic transglycosylase RlpA family protein [Treponemataceae bacterium]
MHTAKVSASAARCALAFFATFALSAAPLAADSELIKIEAIASYYGDEFQGRPTSSGELFDMNAHTCAHKTLPFGTLLEITNLENGRKSVVRVNDRGPFVAGRELDVSKAAAYDLGMVATGTARVSIRRIGMDTGATGDAASNQAVADNATGTAAPGASAGTAPAAGTSAGTATVTVTTVVPKTEGAKAAQATPAAVAAPGVAASGQGNSWRIQLGSFSKEENANRLIVRLREEGFNPAFERNGSMIRVVLAGIPESALGATKDRLLGAGYSGFLVRAE